jgi:hypothetical protein
MSKDANYETSTVNLTSTIIPQNLYMLSELAQYVIQDFCTSRGWMLAAFEGNTKLPKDLFLLDKEGDLNITYLPDKWLKCRSNESTHKTSKEILKDSEFLNTPEKAQKVTKKRKAKVVASVEDAIVRRNADRKARNVVVQDDKSDIENEF